MQDWKKKKPKRLISVWGVTSMQTELGRQCAKNYKTPVIICVIITKTCRVKKRSKLSMKFCSVNKTRDNTWELNHGRLKQRQTKTSHLTSMDWTPSDSSSTKLLFSRGPSMMTGASAGVGASSEVTAPSGIMSDTVNTQRRLKVTLSGKFSGEYYNRGELFSHLMNELIHKNSCWLLTLSQRSQTFFPLRANLSKWKYPWATHW